MKIIKFILLLLYVFCLSSCAKMVYFVLTPQQPHPKKLEKCIEGEDCKKLVYIPMVHLAKPKFYASVKKEVSKLKKEGYVLFYERVYVPDKEIDSMRFDTLKRKFRKIIGIPIGDYTDKDNENYPKFFSNENYVLQSPENSGYSYENDIRVDLTVEQLVEEFESKYGKVKLSDCDFETASKERYRCEKIESKKAKYVLQEIRENHIFDYVKNSAYSKIILLYGKAHYKPLKKRFLKAGFQIK